MINCRYTVYLLKSEVSNRTYVGYTVNLKKRIRQHNGEIKGGAKKTQKYRPWKLVAWVTGFPYERTALQYEFCVQRTKKYRRTSGVKNKLFIMKMLLHQEKICSTAPLNSEMKLAIFFKDISYWKIWQKCN
jgi:predicted GIY-YIG superfamily endonuclease